MRLRPNPTIDREPTENELKNIEQVEQMLSEETPDQFPSKMRMARNLATDHWKSLKAFIKGEKVITSPEEAIRRWKICEECPFLKYDETNPDTGKNTFNFAKNSLKPEIKISRVRIIIAAITS